MTNKPYESAGIPTEYQHIHLECAAYAEAIREGRNVFICGEKGTGKTTLAASVAMCLIDEGVKVKFVNAAIEAARLKPDLSSQWAAYARMVTAPVLVLDDLGKGVPTDWEATFWCSVVEARDYSNLPTLTTSNYDGAELIHRLTVNRDVSTAKAIISRLRRGAVTIKTEGHDMRLLKASEGR